MSKKDKHAKKDNTHTKDSIRANVFKTLGVKNSRDEDRVIVSVRELWKSKLVYWIVSYKALLKYVSKNYKSIFNPIIKGEKSGTRYYISVDSIVEFLWKFENNEL